MSSAAFDIAARLAGLGIGTVGANTGWTIAVGAEPAAPDNAITIYNTGGDEPDTCEQDILRPAFQVRVRSTDYEAGHAKHVAIREALIRSIFATASARFASVRQASGPLDLGTDDRNRYLTTANYTALCTSPT